MNKFERAMAMEVDPDHVFDFVSDLRNLPQFLPTVHRAEKLDGERIRIQGVSHGHPYDGEGHFRLDRHHRKISWGANGDRGYSGWMAVKQGDTTPLVSEITMEIEFAQTPGGAQGGETVLAEMEQALENIRNHFLRRRD